MSSILNFMQYSCICSHYLRKCQTFLNGLSRPLDSVTTSSVLQVNYIQLKGSFFFPLIFSTLLFYPTKHSLEMKHSYSTHYLKCLCYILLFISSIKSQACKHLTNTLTVKPACQPELHQDSNLTALTFPVSPNASSRVPSVDPFSISQLRDKGTRIKDSRDTTVISPAVISKLHSIPSLPATAKDLRLLSQLVVGECFHRSLDSQRARSSAQVVLINFLLGMNCFSVLLCVVSQLLLAAYMPHVEKVSN